LPPVSRRKIGIKQAEFKEAVRQADSALDALHPVAYCCDTIKTLNHTVIVQSILDTNGVLVRFEIVKVLK
jgi:hypothetical protein